MDNNMLTSKRMGDIQEELFIDWKIKDFEKSLNEVDRLYRSRPFSFAGHSWCLKMFPNGESRKCAEYIDLFLARTSFGPSIQIEFSFSFKKLDGEKGKEKIGTHNFDRVDVGNGYSKFFKKSELLERKCDLLPSDVLTVICSLKLLKPICVETNDKLLNDFKALMLSGEYSDTTVKVKDEEFRLHRNVLGFRNAYFHAMFECDMKEKATGNVTIEDCKPEIFRSFIHFVYTGRVDKLSSENVCELYYAADKYQEDQLKNECMQFMMNAVSIDTIVEFLILALEYDEKELLQITTNFFCKKAKTIIRSVKWQNFNKEYPTAANELIIKTLDQYEDDKDSGGPSGKGEEESLPLKYK